MRPFLPVILGLLAASCGPVGEMVCEPGTVDICACLDGWTGGRICVEDGTDWYDCECDEADDDVPADDDSQDDDTTGDDDSSPADDDTEPEPDPYRFSSDDDWVQVTAGMYHTCGRDSDGRVKCWGNVGNLFRRPVHDHRRQLRRDLCDPCRRRPRLLGGLHAAEGSPAWRDLHRGHGRR